MRQARQAAASSHTWRRSIACSRNWALQRPPSYLHESQRCICALTCGCAAGTLPASPISSVAALDPSSGAPGPAACRPLHLGRRPAPTRLQEDPRRRRTMICAALTLPQRPALLCPGPPSRRRRCRRRRHPRCLPLSLPSLSSQPPHRSSTSRASRISQPWRRGGWRA